MRPLTLHVSALNDAEYDLYTTSLNDLAIAGDTDSKTVHDDTHYERMSVGVREARAWLRGRFQDIPASDIDAILKLFHPNLLPSESLKGGQFFAALRLVVHAQSGKGVDRTLAFVQASPNTSNAQDIHRPLSPPKRSVQAPPSHPDRQKPPPTTGPLPSESNPFTRRSIEQSAAPALVDPEPITALPHRHNKISHNPFLNRDKPDFSDAAVATSPDKTVVAVSPTKNGKLPPLPPRKPALLSAPPRRPSDAVPMPITSTANISSPSGPPVIPIKPTHITSPLMRQSLEASKHGQTMKRAEEQLERERVLQVLKTSSTSSLSNNSRTRSLSPSKQVQKLSDGAGSEDATFVPPLPRRRKPSLPSSSSSSLPSLEQVASATLPSTSAPFRPPLPNRDAFSLGMNTDYLPGVAGPGPMPPPTHPDRRPSTSTEPNVNDSLPSSPISPRVMRSKSINYPGSSTSLPPPPPQRKRPESMQLTPTSATTDLPFFPSATTAHPHARTASFQGLSRHLSLTRDKESADSTISNIQKTITNLQLRAQPKLDAVRFKAEAGISRRGYVNHAHLGGARWREEGEEGLITDTRWSAANVDQDPYSEPTTDDEPSSGDDRRGERKKNMGPYRDFLTESDNLKWPAGEGWKPL